MYGSSIDKKNLSDYKKINTMMDSQLHRELKTYCGANDLKKNNVFKEAWTFYMDALENNSISSKVKKPVSKFGREPFNFEIPLEFLKELKSFGYSRGYKLARLYEEAIRYFLEHRKGK